MGVEGIALFAENGLDGWLWGECNGDDGWLVICNVCNIFDWLRLVWVSPYSIEVSLSSKEPTMSFEITISYSTSMWMNLDKFEGINAKSDLFFDNGARIRFFYDT